MARMNIQSREVIIEEVRKRFTEEVEASYKRRMNMNISVTRSQLLYSLHSSSIETIAIKLWFGALFARVKNNIERNPRLGVHTSKGTSASTNKIAFVHPLYLLVCSERNHTWRFHSQMGMGRLSFLFFQSINKKNLLAQRTKNVPSKKIRTYRSKKISTADQGLIILMGMWTYDNHPTVGDYVPRPKRHRQREACEHQKGRDKKSPCEMGPRKIKQSRSCH